MKARLVVAGTATLLVLMLTFSANVASAAIPFCSPGAGAGQCDNPQGVAVDWKTGHVYVVDVGNNRINVFESDGTFLFSFIASGTWVAVDNNNASSSQHDVYAGSENFEIQKFNESGEFIKSFGGKGKGACQLTSIQDPIAVGPVGDVYVADSYEKGVPGHIFENRVSIFDSSGTCIKELSLFEGPNQTIRDVAADSMGNIYVTVAGGGGVIRKYDPTGTLLAEMGGVETSGLAVDAADNLFGKQRGIQVTKFNSLYFVAEYSSDTSLVKRFSYIVSDATPRVVPALAAYEVGGGDEGVFASEGSAGVNFLPVPTGPVVVPDPCHVKPGGLGSVRATLQAEVNPEGKETHFEFEYWSGTEAHQKSPPETLAAPIDFELHEAIQTIQSLKPETIYHCRVVAKNADGGAPSGEEGSFETKEGFEFGPGSTSDVGEEEATVNAEGNPLGLAATAVVEYIPDAQYQANRASQPKKSGFAEALSAPVAELDYGASETMQLRSVKLTDLSPATIYHWRLHVKNGLPPQGIVCPRNGEEPCPVNEHVFRTYGSEEIADNRRWELVSPGQKNGAEVAAPGIASGVGEDRYMRIQVSSGSGEAATFTSFTSFGREAEAAPATSQYLARRTSWGWVTENISPFGFQNPIPSIPFKGFTPELSFAAFKVTKGALAPGCQEGVENLYLRNTTTSTLTCLTPEIPQEGSIGCMVYAGASEDGSRVFFASAASYAGVAKGDGFGLYEWSAANGLKPVSILPGQSEPAEPTPGTTFGPNLGREIITNCQFGQTVMRHVVSADGSKAFWTYLPAGVEQSSSLLARLNGAETVQLDAVPEGQKKGKEKPGEGPSGNGVFWAASKDGSVVYFATPGRLISGSKAEQAEPKHNIPAAPDLYRYEFGKAEPLSDLTKGVKANVQGVVGASDDGSYIYFVAKGVLSGEESAAGQKAEEGADNLYLFHEGKTSFIALLSPEDLNDWASQPKNSSARVSRDGRHLAFLSLESQALAGYANTVAEGQHCQIKVGERNFHDSPLCAEGFLYDAGSDALSCATCNPTGARPLGPAALPGWSNVYEGPRYLSDDGSRFFFETFDALVKSDVNGKKRDVYEFERPGSGICTVQSGAFDPASGGCHFLVSRGDSSNESYLLDASFNGRDVFFSTQSKLVGWDTNENYDIYDFREGGGFAEPTEPPVCLGEASCKPPPTAPPASSSPSTPIFTGPGNPAPKTPKPHRHKKRHKQKKKAHPNKKGARR